MPITLRGLITGLGLRRAPRSRSLVQMANSLDLIARALSTIVYKEYHIDLTGPSPSRSDLKREVFEPMYPDSVAEAVREEVEMLQRLEAETSAPAPQSDGRRNTSLSMGMVNAAGDDTDLTPEERQFLAEPYED